jgi:peptidoglycan/xylan/chitin deacetylase (PgdA/CDA1 family)
MSSLPERFTLFSVIIASIILLASYSLTNNPADADPSNDALQVHSCHCVAFRLDDVQDYPYSSPLIEVMELFREKNIPLTIGVIGNNIDTENKQVYYYVKQRLLNNISPIGQNKAVIEIANHSWEHGRFLNFTFQEQYYSIRKTNEKIKSSFGILPTLFIPPSNEFNNDTLYAMHKNNMTIISADERDITAYSSYPNNTIYHLPETAETGNCRICSGNNFSWYGIQSEETMNQIKKSINVRGFAIVVMHPMEYSLEHDDPIFQNSLDLRQVAELESLIYKIQLEGLNIVTIGNIENYVGKS